MLELRQTLGLQQTLSPQQVLLSSLLQLPVLAMEQRVRMEMETNPVLEEATEEEALVEEEAEPEEQGEEDEFDLSELMNDMDDSEPRLPKGNGREEGLTEQPEPDRPTFTEHLLEQLNLMPLEARERTIGESIIWNIDRKGYLSATVEEIAVWTHASADEVEVVLRQVQRLDPPGVGARDLRECLLVQLEDAGQDGVPLTIVRDHFEDFANRRFEKIGRATQLSLDEIREANEVIAKLNPKPAEDYDNPVSSYIVPDFVVEKVDGEFVVSMNDWQVPALKISESYRRMASDRKHIDAATREFLRKKIESARWLITSIHQRRQTMFNVMSSIVSRQKDWFEKGPGHFKPMIQKDVADDLGMHVATVSRVSSGKYAQTPHGVYELKSFFSEGLVKEDGEEVSTRNIKRLVRSLIEDEPADSPLSDEKLARRLKVEGYKVARRTVAKYREQMEIPVARLRRRPWEE